MKLLICIDVDDEMNPECIDPEEIAHDILTAAQAIDSWIADDRLTVIGAAWADEALDEMHSMAFHPDRAEVAAALLASVLSDYQP